MDTDPEKSICHLLEKNHRDYATKVTSVSHSLEHSSAEEAIFKDSVVIVTLKGKGEQILFS